MQIGKINILLFYTEDQVVHTSKTQVNGPLQQYVPRTEFKVPEDPEL